MEGKVNIYFQNIGKEEVLQAPLPDGYYAVISHNPYTHTARGMPMVFPWSAVVYKFVGGKAEMVGHGSNPAGVLVGHKLKRVFLVGLDAKERAELDGNLAARNISLVQPEMVTA